MNPALQAFVVATVCAAPVLAAIAVVQFARDLRRHGGWRAMLARYMADAFPPRSTEPPPEIPGQRGWTRGEWEDRTVGTTVHGRPRRDDPDEAAAWFRGLAEPSGDDAVWHRLPVTASRNTWGADEDPPAAVPPAAGESPGPVSPPHADGGAPPVHAPGPGTNPKPWRPGCHPVPCAHQPGYWGDDTAVWYREPVGAYTARMAAIGGE